MANSKDMLCSDILHVSLLEGTRLYLATGVPQAFRRVTEDGRNGFEDSWLYIPHGQLLSVQETLTAEAGSPDASCISSSAIEIDDKSVYPVLVDGRLRGVLTADSQVPLESAGRLADSVQNAIDSQDSLLTSKDQSVAGEFVDKLFERDRNADDFLKAMLHILTDQWAGTLGAIYCQQDGIYRIRFAVGDISRFDNLAHTAAPAAAGEWATAIQHKSYFVPGEALPEYACFLARPPGFLFVHPSMRSHRTEYLIVLCLSGDIDGSAASALREIAGLSCRLHESQFSTAAETVRLYGRLNLAAKSALALDDILLESFKALSRQLEVSRMVVTRDTGLAKVVSRRASVEPLVRDVDEMPLCVSAAELPGDGEPWLYSDIQSEFRHSPEAKRYHLDHVNSELQFPIELPGIDGVVAFGSPLHGNYLLTGKDFLAAVAQLVGLSIMLSEVAMVPSGASSAESSERSTDQALQRFHTIHKLAGGHFHDLLSLLSVVVGQAEIMQGELCSGGGSDTAPMHQTGMNRIAQAANQMAAVLPMLRDLCMLDNESLERRMPCHRLMAELPVLLRGYTRQMADTKNISVTIEAAVTGSADFALRYIDICDCILPFLLTVMDEAICSGAIEVEACLGARGESVILTFDRAMVGHTGLGNLLTRACGRRLCRIHGEETGEVKIGSFVIGFGPAEEGKYRFNMVREVRGGRHRSQQEQTVAAQLRGED